MEVTKKYLTLLKKLIMRIWPRLLLYTVLIVIIVGSVVFWVTTSRSSLSENFLAGSIEIAITIILIDGLLSLERRRRIKALNTRHANALTYYLGMIIVKFMKEFKFPIEPNNLEVVGMSNDALKEKVDDFFGSTQYNQYLQDIKNAKKGISKRLKNLGELVTTSAKSVNESLEKAEPYPDPALTKLINDTQPNIIASIEVIATMYGALKIIRDAKEASDATLAKNIMDQEMERITTNQGAIDNRINVHDAFRSFLDAVLTIHERAEKNSLHYDV